MTTTKETFGNMNKPMSTKIQRFIKKYKPCQEATDWLLTQKDLRTAYKDCKNSYWMWWTVRKLGLADKDISVKYANLCVEHIKYLNNPWAAADAIADAAFAPCFATAAANVAAASASYHAAYAAAAAANAAAAAYYAAAAATAAADAATANYNKEQSWQCDQIRNLIPYNKIKI